jgi:hypothetical protein
VYAQILQSVQLVAKYNPKQRRAPKGTSTGGQFAFQFQSINTPSAAMKKEPLPKTVAEAEDRIRYEPNEHAFLIRDGKPYKVLGSDDPHHINMEDMTPEDLKDAILTHNHPSGLGLSNRDGVTAAKFNMREMRAVTATGTHVLRRTGTEWHPYFADGIQEIHNRLMPELAMQIRAGIITKDEANTQHHIRLYQELEQWLSGFTYTFEPKS